MKQGDLVKLMQLAKDRGVSRKQHSSVGVVQTTPTQPDVVRVKWPGQKAGEYIARRFIEPEKPTP